ncbi:MAG: isoaspartyl peptidase/L-asparaginase [Nitrospinaceae bacterium]
MNEPWKIVLAHGGAGSRAEYRDGAETACRVGFENLQSGALNAACTAVAALENDGRFNAGVGSRRRSDGSVQADAACMDSGRRFGAVAAVTGFRHPVKIAQALTACPQHLLAGPGAAAFAHHRGMEVWTPEPEDQNRGRVAGCDTVGCVTFDGDRFAAALSTGGKGGSLPGRVGDVPLLGCGLYTGQYGAVVATGLGEVIVLNMTAFRAYQMLEEGMGPRFVLDEALGWFEEDEDIGLLLVSRKGYAGGSNRSMAWAALETGERE